MLKRPLIFPAAVFSSGILVAFSGASLMEVILCAIFFLVVFNALIAAKLLSFSALSFITSLLFVAGAANFHLSESADAYSLKGIEEERRVTIYSHAKTMPEKRNDSVKFALDCSRLCLWDNNYVCSDCSFSIDAFADISANMPMEGDFVVVGGTIRYRTTEKGKLPFYLKADEIIIVKNLSGKGLKKSLALFRTRIAEMLSNLPDSEAASLFSAMVLGERSGLSEAVNDDFIKTGTTHLLSISGLHITAFIILIFFLLRAILSLFPTVHLFVPVQISAGIASIVVAGIYVVFTGSQIPTVRAALMGLLFLSAPFFKRFHDMESSIAFAWLAIILLNPADLLSPSFILSFLAVVAIVKYHPVINSWLQSAIKTERKYLKKTLFYASSLFACSLAAYIGTTPPLIILFNNSCLSAVFVNILAVPFSSFVLLPAGLIIAALYAIDPDISSAFAGLATYGARFFIDSISFFASLTSFYAMPIDTPAGAAITALCLLTAIFMTAGFSLKSYIIAAIIIIVSATSVGFIQKDSSRLDVTFIDVKHGDSILIEFPCSEKALIDAGGTHDQKIDIGRRKIVPLLADRGISTLDYLMLTHPHPDHINGMYHIARTLDVKKIVVPAKFKENEAVLSLVEIVQSKDGAVQYITENEEFFESCGARMKIFAYDIEETGKTHSDINNDSLIVQIEHGSHSFLFCGDIEEEGEERLISNPEIGDVTVFKANHHGSLTSNGEVFLERISPEYVVFSSYSRGPIILPRQEVVDRTLRVGASLLPTELYGNITFSSDGKEISIQSDRKPEPQDIAAFLSRLEKRGKQF